MNLYQLLVIAAIILCCCCFFFKKLTLNFAGIQPIKIGTGRKPYAAYCSEIIFLVIAIGNLLCQLFTIFFSHQFLFEITWLRIVGVIFCMLGATLYITSLIFMRKSWRLGIDYNERPTLIREGIYRFLRNPAYLGMDFLCLGVFFSFSSYLLLAATLAMFVIIHIQIIQEEQYLPGIHGERYIRYKKRTRRYL